MVSGAAAALLQLAHATQHSGTPRLLFPAVQQLCQQQRQLHWGSTSPDSSSSSSSFSGTADGTELTDTLISSSAPLASSVAEAITTAAAAGAGVPDLGMFAAGAAALEAVHATTGLPWVAVIPAAAVAIKSLLLPLSLKQAKIVRTNMVLWKEAYEFQKQHHARRDRQKLEAQQQQQQQQQGLLYEQEQQPQQPQQPQQQQQQQQSKTASATPGALDAAAAALQQLQQWQERMHLFHDLRRKCGVPHPAWLLVNGSLQVPVFIYSAATIRRMAQASWPGFSSEGALWFTDLTQPALLMSQAGLQLPLGLPGLLLPCAATAIMLTSIHLGFKASGAAAKHPSLAGTWLSTALVYLRPFLYAVTVASAAIKVQLPQAPVLHWVTTASYTLGLQLGLRSPRVRQLLGFSQAGSVDSSKEVDPAVVAQAAAMDNGDVLVVMGAKQAALQRYNEAMHCLQHALQLDPNNTRAHYSAGQIFAMQGQWPQSEASYRACARLATEPASQAQALYCVGVACHQQGSYTAAVEAYTAAEAAGPDDHLQPMLALGTARALQQLGQGSEAAAVAGRALGSGWASSCPPPVMEALKELAEPGSAPSADASAAGRPNS